MSNLGTTTYAGAVKRGLAFKNGDQLWVAIGRTAAWPNESSPPSPERGAAGIDTPIVFVKPIILSMARVVSEEDYNAAEVGQRARVITNGAETFYVFVADGDAQAQYARFLYYRGEFNPVSGMPVAPYRQVGIYSGLVPAAGYEAASWLAPANVTDAGLLEYLDNGEVVNMSESGPVSGVHGAIEFR